MEISGGGNLLETKNCLECKKFLELKIYIETVCYTYGCTIDNLRELYHESDHSDNMIDWMVGEVDS